MRFREFLESTTGGWYDDKEDTRPTFTSRQQELPGTTMHLGQDEVQGEVISRQGSLLQVQTHNGLKKVALPENYLDREKEIPQVGDRIRAILNRDGTYEDCQIIHRKSETQPLANGAGAPTVAGLG